MSAKKPNTDRQAVTFEPEPDAWERFEKAVGKVVKAPPQHRGARVPKTKKTLAMERKGTK